MLAVAPVVDAVRGAGRSKDEGEVASVGLEGAGGDEVEGESRGVSESKSASGVVTGDAIARDRCAGCWWERPGGGRESREQKRGQKRSR